MGPSEFPLDELVSQGPQIEALARRIVGDVHRAEDLAQDVYLAALQAPRQAIRSPRRWFGGVLRNLSLQSNREEARRRRREREVAQPELHDPELSRQRFAAMKRVVDELSTLREPYRETLVMRFFDGLTPLEIASHLELPVRTVHSRVTRGLALMRDQLDGDASSGNGAWCALGVLFELDDANSSGWRTWPSWLPAGLLAGAATAALGITALLSGASSRATDVSQVHGREASPRLGNGYELSPIASTASRTPVTGASASVRPSSRQRIAQAGPERLSGRVVDVDGVPVEAVGVAFQPGHVTSNLAAGTHFQPHLESDYPETAPVETSREGLFELPLPTGFAGLVLADDSEWVTVIGTVVPLVDAAPSELVVARRCPIVGEVVDAGGAPLAGALVQWLPPESLIDAQRRTEGSWMSVEPRAETDASGRFAIKDGFDLVGAHLRVTRSGFRPLLTSAKGAGAVDLSLTLEALPSHSVIRGVVLTDEGAPALDAAVVVDGQITQVEPDGYFEVPVADSANAASIRAAARGYRPTQFYAPIDPDGRSVWPPEVVLVLPGKALSIEGRLVGPDDKPVANALVWAADPTPFGRSHQPWFTENIIHGVENGLHIAVKTDSAGSFSLPALLDREYVIRAAPFDSMVQVERVGVAAGSRGVEMWVDRDASLVHFTGRVVTVDGRPVAGARLSPRRPAIAERFDGSKVVTVDITGDPVYTDRSGRFALDPIPPGCELEVVGDGLFQSTHVLAGDGSEPLLIVAPRSACFRVTAPNVKGRAIVRLLDANGRKTKISRQLNNTDPLARERSTKGELRDGESDLLVVAEGSYEIVLRADGKELLREPVHLAAGELNRIDL